MAATASQIQAIESKLSGSKISRTRMTWLGIHFNVYCMTEDGPMCFGMVYCYEHKGWKIGLTSMTDESKLAPKAWYEL